MAKQFVGGHSLGLEEVVLASVARAVVLVEDGVAAKLKLPATLSPIASFPLKPLNQLSIAQSRAVILGVLNQSLQGSAGTRPELTGSFAQLLSVSDSLAHGLPASSGEELAKSLAAHGGSTLETQAADETALLALTGPAAGLSSLAVFGAHACLTLADAVAAVTVEALRASITPYEADTNDAVRAVSGQTASASNLRLLLEGSLESGKSALAKDGTESLPLAHAIVHISSMHGAGAAPILAGVRAVSAELNATPAPATSSPPSGKSGEASKRSGAHSGHRPSHPATMHAQPLLTALQSTAAGVDCLIAASRERCAVLCLAAGPSGAPALPPCLPASCSFTCMDAGAAGWAAMQAGLDCQARVDELLRCLAAELKFASDSILRPREGAQAEALLTKAKAKAASAAAREAADAAKAAGMEPEARAKWEAELAKRKEKAAKRAEESGPVDSEDASVACVNPLGLALGTWEFLSHVRSMAAAIEEHGFLRALSPYFPAAAVVGEAASFSLGPANCPVPATVSERPDGTSAIRTDVLLRRLLEKLSSGGSKRKPKIAKGARDYGPEQMEVRESCFNTIRAVFKRHGACEIDTPVFELKETLLGKYGEEGGKLIYDLADQGGELLSLRYDLTVPFARYLALHGVEAMKRFHIAKVYRRDNPQISKGRYREFYQCDYDVAGVYAPMMPDAEVLKVAVDILSAVPIGEFTIKLNHRKLLDAMLEIAGVPTSKFRPICSAIDKLDKEEWAVVREEMVVEKGLPPSVADRIGAMVQLRGEPKALLAQLQATDSFFTGNASSQSALNDLVILAGYLEAMGALPYITLDLSLARGLDYYTGVIYEAVLLDPTVGVGSIAAGGRYDNLVGMFAAAGTVVPCVGVSVGVERVFAIMEAKAAAAAGGLKKSGVQVLVASIPSTRYDMVRERMRTCAELWSAGLSAEMLYAENPKLAKQMTAALEDGIPYIVILAEDELDKGKVQVKDLNGRAQATVERTAVVQTLLGMGARVTTAGVNLAPAPAVATLLAPTSAPSAAE